MGARIGFIGVGNMGSAMVRGLAGREDIELCGCDLNRAKLEELAKGYAFTPLAGPVEVAKAADYVVLAVKPQQMKPMLEQLAPHLTPNKCLVSIAAGITQERLTRWSHAACPVVRVMPNTPALVGAGVFAVCLDDPRLTDSHRALVPDMLSSIGRVHVLPETQFDAFTGVIGSGPAYVVYFMEAMVDAAVTLGLPRPQAKDMVLGLFLGTSTMAQESDLHLAELREMVTSPGGTTAQGLNEMDRRGVRAAIIDAADASCQRSIELGSS